MGSATVTFEAVSDTLAGIGKRIADAAGDTTIGVHEDAEPYPDGTDAVTVASAQEFGAGRIPPRPHVRRYYDSGGAREMGDVGARALGKVIDGAAASLIGEEIGKLGQAGVRDLIESGQLDPLSPVTLANPDRDPRGIPLLDTGHLVEQITHRTGGD
jgi:hypothetical protein